MSDNQPSVNEAVKAIITLRDMFLSEEFQNKRKEFIENLRESLKEGKENAENAEKIVNGIKDSLSKYR